MLRPRMEVPADFPQIDGVVQEIGDCARFPALPACGGNPHGVEPAGDFVARNPCAHRRNIH